MGELGATFCPIRGDVWHLTKRTTVNGRAKGTYLNYSYVTTNAGNPASPVPRDYRGQPAARIRRENMNLSARL